MQDALFERRTLKVMSGLSSLRIGATTKTEVLSQTAGAKVDGRFRGVRDCNADECLTITIPNSRLSDWLLLPTARTGHGTLFSVLSWLGLRYHTLEAHIDFVGSKVSRLDYQLILSTPDATYPGAIFINAHSNTSARRYTGISGSVGDESPDYGVSHFPKWSTLRTDVYFTPDAPAELASHAFNLKLRCLWSFSGCRTANQLLPEAEQDRLKIERAASERMAGPNQCPDRILQHRARDTEGILLVEVRSSTPAFVAYDDGSHHRRTSFRLLRVLKGKPDRSLNNVVVTSEIWDGVRAHNSAFDLLTPGQKLLLFSGGGTNIDEPCEAVAATDSAVQTLERFLTSAKP
jgi:hypothetical protein